MKKKFLLLSTAFLSVAAMAQGPSFGVKAGVTSSSMKGDAVNSLQNIIDFSNGMISTGNHTGLFAGVNTNIPLGGIFSVEPGVYYAQKGYSLNGDLALKGAEFIGANAKAQLTSHYIDLPVVLKANLSGFQVFVGPQVSYLAKADFKTTAGVLGFNILNRKLDATDQLNRWDAGFTGGVGYEFANGLSLSAAYDHGLLKADANKNLDSYNRSFKVGVGLRF